MLTWDETFGLPDHDQTLESFVECVLQKVGAGLHPSWNICERLTLMSIEMGGSPHSVTPRHEQGLSWILWLLGTEIGMATLAERSELRLSLDSNVTRRSM